MCLRKLSEKCSEMENIQTQTVARRNSNAKNASTSTLLSHNFNRFLIILERHLEEGSDARHVCVCALHSRFRLHSRIVFYANTKNVIKTNRSGLFNFIFASSCYAADCFARSTGNNIRGKQERQTWMSFDWSFMPTWLQYLYAFMRFVTNKLDSFQASSSCSLNDE